MITPARIYRGINEIRFEVTDTMHVYASSSHVVTIEEKDEDVKNLLSPGEINLWTDDIDALIDALLALKNEIRKEYGYDK